MDCSIKQVYLKSGQVLSSLLLTCHMCASLHAELLTAFDGIIRLACDLDLGNIPYLQEQGITVSVLI